MKYLYLLLLLPGLAFAQNDCPPGHENNSSCDETDSGYVVDVDTNVDTEALANAESNLANSINTKNDYDFVAFSTTFPELQDCMGGVQGAGKAKDLGGLFGMNYINDSCWLQKLSESETNVDIKARLKCGDSKYRNAIAWQKPRKERREACIKYVSAIWILEIQKQREAANACKKGTCSYVNGVLRYEFDD